MKPTAPWARRPLLRALAGVALGGVLAPAAAADGAQRHAWPANRPTPALDLPRWGGGRWRSQEARGQVLVLNFWASWCEPCRAELPSLELLAQRHEKQGLQVLAINFRETDAALRRFLESSTTDLPVLRDADGAAAQAYGARIFPTTVVIGRDGRARFSVIGEVDWGGAEARRWMADVL